MDVASLQLAVGAGEVDELECARRRGNRVGKGNEPGPRLVDDDGVARRNVLPLLDAQAGEGCALGSDGRQAVIAPQIGRASCRESGWSPDVAVSSLDNRL